MNRHCSIGVVPVAALAAIVGLAGCGGETGGIRFEGRYLLTIRPGPECDLPIALAVEVEAATGSAAGPGQRLEVTLRPRRASGIYALTVDLLFADGFLRGGMTSGNEGQCANPEQDCGVTTRGDDPRRLHLEGVAEAKVEELGGRGRVAMGMLEGDILLGEPGDESIDAFGACSSDAHRWTLDPVGERVR